MIHVSWKALKTLITAKGVVAQYIDDTDYLHVFFIEASMSVVATINKRLEKEDLEDFEANFKPAANASLWQADTDGAQIVRIKAAKRGWTYCAVPIEFQTSQLDSLYCKNVDGTDRAGITLKFYDGQDNEITDQGELEINETQIVKTVIDFEPPYDYEVIGGQLRIEQDINSPNDCRLFIIAVPDIPANLGGSKEMAGGVNLKYLAPDNAFDVDGRVAKFLKYDAQLHTNKLRMILMHSAGMKVWIHMTMELYRA
jgi:hypothetical protein